MTHKLNGGIPNWGYTHWWKMFNPRQLLVHTQLLRSILGSSSDVYSMDIREQALGAFQQYLRNQNMFCFWDMDYDKLVPMMSNANYHPKSRVIENNVYHKIGRGNLCSCVNNILKGVSWENKPWEIALNPTSSGGKSVRYELEDIVSVGSQIHCGSSTDLTTINSESLDLVITDPPFGNNLFYADLADFFFVWLRRPLAQLYEGLAEKAYFENERSPHSMEAIDNSIEHPEDREGCEKDVYVSERHLDTIRQTSGDNSIEVNDPNPLYRRAPAPEFYRNTLTACWTEANRVLKTGGMMAFTFHHSADEPWVDVLEALFDSGFILVATYPVRSDETKGEKGAFGSRKIEYDIIHVCRKRLEDPQPVSWAKMRRWVRNEGQQLKELLEHTHGDEVPGADLRVILIGKSLEFYSRHYGQVYTGDGQLLSVRDALLGIDQIIDDIFAVGEEEGQRPPAEAEPASRLFLRIFIGLESIPRDDLHKTLRGTGMSQGDLEARGWIRAVGTTIHVVPVAERFEYFTTRGRTRQVIKTDLDHVHFLIGACMHGSGIDVNAELDRNTFRIKKSVDAILGWFAHRDSDKEVAEAAQLALDLVTHWRSKPKAKTVEQLTLFEMLENED